MAKETVRKTITKQAVIDYAAKEITALNDNKDYINLPLDEQIIYLKKSLEINTMIIKFMRFVESWEPPTEESN